MIQPAECLAHVVIVRTGKDNKSAALSWRHSREHVSILITVWLDCWSGIT